MSLKGKPTASQVPQDVYFTVVINAGGVADTLNSYYQLRALGLSLGLTCLHSHIVIHRSSGNPGRLRWLEVLIGRRYSAYIALDRRWLHFKQRLIAGWEKYSLPFSAALLRIAGGPSDFLGFNQHDPALPSVADFPQEARHTFCLSDRILEKENLSTYEELMRYMKGFIAKRKRVGQPLLLVLEREYPLQRYRASVQPGMSHQAGHLDFRTQYFQRRKIWPQKSLFLPQRLKVLAHLRLGDRAAFPTPWGTWAYFSPRRCPLSPQQHFKINETWRETKTQEQAFLQLTAADLCSFLRGLISHLPPNSTYTQLFSDGFERTQSAVFQHTSEKANGLNVSPWQTVEGYQQVKKSLKHEQRQLQAHFKSIPSSTCFIGESQPKLFRLIHGLVEANLIITAYPVQQSLATTISYFYGDSSANKPVVLFVRKARYQAVGDLSLWSSVLKPTNSILVDIEEPNFPALVERIEALLAPPPPYTTQGMRGASACGDETTASERLSYIKVRGDEYYRLRRPPRGGL